ncbi:unnamed protein product [Gordionus sp. m RMFG-2023]
MSHFFITNLLFSSLKLLVSGFEGDSVFKYTPCKKINLIAGGNMNINITDHNLSLQYARYTLTPHVLSTNPYLNVILYILVALNTWIPVICLLTCNVFIVRKIWNNRKRIHSHMPAPARTSLVALTANNNEYKNTNTFTSLQSLSSKMSQTNLLSKLAETQTNGGYDHCDRSDCNTKLREKMNGIRHLSVVHEPFTKPLQRIKFLVKKIRPKKVVPSSSIKEARATKLLLMVSMAHLISITPIGVVQTLELVLVKSPLSKQFLMVHPYILTNTKMARIYLFALYELTFATNFVWYLIFTSKKSFGRISCIK